MLRSPVRRPRRAHRPYLLPGLAVAVILLLLVFRHTLHTTWTLLALPIVWWRGSPQFLLSAEVDRFDVSFANYSVSQDRAGGGYADRIPPVLHHIVLGSRAAESAASGDGGSEAVYKWHDARQSCLDVHPGWDAHLWTDEKAARFVADKFPHLKAMWEGYRYPVERVDALRYMLLYEYGGVVLDMDLRCKRSLGPLRRFEFVAPAAHPIGFSNGFMMAPRHSAFMGEIIASLQPYNKQWFGLPYPTVMFSTGCHFASTIHSLQPDRASLKILAGPRDNFRLHSLNGHVSTPLFDHLGSSSWHSYDAAVINWFGHLSRYAVGVLAVAVLALGAAMFWCSSGARRGTYIRRLSRGGLPSPRWFIRGRRSSENLEEDVYDDVMLLSSGDKSV